MTLASLKRCVQKGLLTRPQASVLFRELGLTLPGTVSPVAGRAAPPPSALPRDGAIERLGLLASPGPELVAVAEVPPLIGVLPEPGRLHRLP